MVSPSALPVSSSVFRELPSCTSRVSSRLALLRAVRSRTNLISLLCAFSSRPQPSEVICLDRAVGGVRTRECIWRREEEGRARARARAGKLLMPSVIYCANRVRVVVAGCEPVQAPRSTYPIYQFRRVSRSAALLRSSIISNRRKLNEFEISAHSLSYTGIQNFEGTLIKGYNEFILASLFSQLFCVNNSSHFFGRAVGSSNCIASQLFSFASEFRYY